MEPESTPRGTTQLGITKEILRKTALPVSFTIPEKVIHFLTENMPHAYCDDCLAEALRLRRTQVNTVTSTLGLCREFSRGAQTCQLCSKPGKSATRRPPFELEGRTKGSRSRLPWILVLDGISVRPVSSAPELYAWGRPSALPWSAAHPFPSS